MGERRVHLLLDLVGHEALADLGLDEEPVGALRGLDTPEDQHEETDREGEDQQRDRDQEQREDVRGELGLLLRHAARTLVGGELGIQQDLLTRLAIPLALALLRLAALAPAAPAASVAVALRSVPSVVVHREPSAGFVRRVARPDALGLHGAP